MAKNIAQLAAKPQLIKITLASEEILKNHGEEVDFWTWDRQPLDVFMKLASANPEDQASLVNVLRTLILDEHGKQVISGDAMLPTDILVAAMQEITKLLGK